MTNQSHVYLPGVNRECVGCGHTEPFDGFCSTCGQRGHRAIHCQNPILPYTREQFEAIYGRWQVNDQSYAHGDITSLLAEIERLRTANAQMLEHGREMWAENERLRALLTEVVTDEYSHSLDEAPGNFAERAKAALGCSVETSAVEPSFAGLKLVTVVDGSVPPDTIEFRASDGRVLGRIRQLAIASVKAKATRITFVTGGEVPDGCLCWTSEGVLFSPAPDCPIHAERTREQR